MNVNTIFPSRYVKAADLGDKNVTVTIKTAVMENLGYGKEAESKLVIYFVNATKGLILNRTNAMIIASMYTPETDNWVGKAIVLYAARVKAFGAWHEAVRVREQIPARNVGAAQMPEALTEPPPLDDEDDLLDADEGDALFTPQQAPQPPAPGQRATTTPDTPHSHATPVEGDAGDSGSAPTDEEHDIISQWDGPRDAQNFALMIGACDNEHHASESWMASVKACRGYSAKNKQDVFLHFLRHQREKLGTEAVAA